MAVRFAERFGTPGGDVLQGSRGTVTYGLAGNDTLGSDDGSAFSILIGGSGDDTYVSGANRTITIADTGGGNDRLFTSITLASNTLTALVDGRHFAAVNQDTGEAVFIFDFLQPQNAIEQITTPDGTFSSQSLFAFAQQRASYQGNIAWENVAKIGLTHPFTTAETNEAISYYSQRANALEITLPAGEDGTIYRFFNTQNGTHFYTASLSERDSVATTLFNYRYEGAAFQSADDSAPDAIDVFRFYNTATGTHFYTANAAERDLLIRSGSTYQFEGEAYEAYSQDGAGREALHRFYNTQTGTHFYTANESERDLVAATLPQYRYEGIGYYVDA